MLLKSAPPVVGFRGNLYRVQYPCVAELWYLAAVPVIKKVNVWILLCTVRCTSRVQVVVLVVYGTLHMSVRLLIQVVYGTFYKDCAVPHAGSVGYFAH